MKFVFGFAVTARVYACISKHLPLVSYVSLYNQLILMRFESVFASKYFQYQSQNSAECESSILYQLNSILHVNLITNTIVIKISAYQ